MARQLKLDLPFRPALGRGDFYVSDANALATAQIDGWRDWPGRKLVLTGPKGSGKTHLAHVWRAESGAAILQSRDLPDADIPQLAEAHVCVEDVPAVAGIAEAEEALFHLHNLTLAQGNSLLLTAITPPAQWRLGLPDLASRVMGTQAARLTHPDDDLLCAVLAKLFADRQIVPAPDAISYLVRHMPRSFDMAGRLVDAIDDAALGTPKGASRSLARRILAEIEPQFDEDAT
ncbi:chromosomal replication initiator DnaA [Puniceibacterium confluentis]|uniref:chromosomal replication initiator DnaA n=1 Tax=Puniceibacterium confluentis TaxID=1958944 RepID=UPI0011B642C3|nr:chromosomal replication initiator DnaA [Puniceibacterium confluentis]